MLYGKALRKLSAMPFRRLWKYARSLVFKDSIDELGTCDILFFSHDVDRSARWLGQPFSPLTENLSAALDKAGIRTGHISYFGSSQSVAYPLTTVHLMNRWYLRTLLADLLRTVLPRTRKSGSHHFVGAKRLFLKIIERSGAKVVVTIGLPKPLALAAHAKDVHLVEVLHGFGYEPLPWDYAERTVSELPNEFWVGDSLSMRTFSELETKGVRSTLIQPLQLVIPGRTGDPARQAVSHPPFHRVTERSPLQSGQFARVLVALSRGGYFGAKIDGRVEDWSLLDRLVAESDQRARWFFRLHPIHVAEGERSPTFKKVLGLVQRYETCSWEWATISPPAVVYPEVDSLLTWGSEAVFDAYFSGLASGVVLPEGQSVSDAVGKRRALDYLSENHSLTYLRPDLSEILSWVSSQTSNERKLRIEPGARDLASLVQRCVELVRAE